MSNALITETLDETDLLDFTSLVTFTNATTPKTESARNFAAESFETLVQAAEKRAEAKAVLVPVSVRFVGNGKSKTHVFVDGPRGWFKFSAYATVECSAEQWRIIEQAKAAHPGCDIGCAVKKGHL